jgi:D-alanyl-D-alanine carboxypeptidase
MPAVQDDGRITSRSTLRTSGPLFPAGSAISYANINYILLGTIIEHVTGRPLWETLRSDVLDHPGLDGLVYGVKDALAADGWNIESDPATLARWGYELYGGVVLPDASLAQMTDFRGDWYGLGAIDFSQGTPAIVDGYGIPAVGHGGLEPSIAVMLVAFPLTGVVVAVQANGGTIPQVATVVGALRDAAQP